MESKSESDAQPSAPYYDASTLSELYDYLKTTFRATENSSFISTTEEQLLNCFVSSSFTTWSRLSHWAPPQEREFYRSQACSELSHFKDLTSESEKANKEYLQMIHDLTEEALKLAKGVCEEGKLDKVDTTKTLELNEALDVCQKLEQLSVKIGKALKEIP